MNKADCSTCDHKQYPDGGHCYMFKTEPVETCQMHTAMRIKFIVSGISAVERKSYIKPLWAASPAAAKRLAELMGLCDVQVRESGL